jgi:hypothetical protein
MISSAFMWIRSHEKHLVYGGGVVAIGVLCFVFGVLKGAELSQEPITIMRPHSAPITLPCEASGEEAAGITAEECKFVGSIKGKKYYPPSCSYAKNISKENLRCFTSDADAQEKGYERSTSC